MDSAVVTDRERFERAAGDGVRVPVELRVEGVKPFDAYRRARGDDPGFFYETTGGSDGWGYFGVQPDAFLETDDGALETLREFETDTLARAGCDVPFPGGYAGWLSYDAARELETLPDSAADDRGLPRLQFGRYDALAAWPEPFDGDVRVVAAPRDATFDEAVARADELVERVQTGDPGVSKPDVSPGPFVSECGREAFAERVRDVKAAVRDGDTFQANVSQRLAAPASVHPATVYAALRDANPAPYSGLVEFPGVDLVSASPELLLERDGDRLRTEPIAGTRPRGDTPAADDALEAELRGDEKERAEHAMLVDLERNDLGKVSEYGSVEVAEYRRVDRYSEVMHLVSDVTGTLRDDQSLADAVAAVFPGGTITGAPKPRTMELIDAVEATRRGPYTGSMGLVGFDGRAVLNIVIRTLVRHREEYHLRVGAGVVHDSDPAAEYDETLAKARALVTALDDALEASLEVES
ncbi:aminodeoxychorismate synthase, component I [Salarchaeum sp. JOR-1]|uniref:aminodeoxychorismate synthase, component I n=1 Tax=Salarchaeum sp. JOR-1 TaxID=2599399 RepID=UPI001198BF96|nr:aminodeoxychorismate synthase, component I [Salarchaeum sp. JOR-1]QDX39693.1 aminodeoxychorismate synthase, component I [Salarchaeum sp. JOR-1]